METNKEIEFSDYIDSPVGILHIKADSTSIISIKFTEKQGKQSSKTPQCVGICKSQLAEYFNGTRTFFDFPVAPKGTEFQRKVWSQLIKIPYGKKVSYKDVAIKIGNPKAARAIGMANNKNPISIVIPCHRVIGSNKKLAGYAGGLERKEWLLKHEISEF